MTYMYVCTYVVVMGILLPFRGLDLGVTKSSLYQWCVAMHSTPMVGFNCRDLIRKTKEKKKKKKKDLEKGKVRTTPPPSLDKPKQKILKKRNGSKIK